MKGDNFLIKKRILIKKRFLSIALALCMLLSAPLLTPVVVMAANIFTEWEPPAEPSDLQKLINDAPENSTVKLENDYTDEAGRLIVNKSVTLDLNGHLIVALGDATVIRIDGGHLTLTDSNPTATHSGTYAQLSGGVIASSNIAPPTNGGGVLIYGSGTFTMEGGTIYNCTASSIGGGVCIDKNCTFTMNGGTISNCKAPNGGGGVYINTNGTFNMNGGTISNCKATNSGNSILNEGKLANTSTTGGATICYNSFTNNGSIEGKTVTFNNQAGYAWEIVPNNGSAVKPTDPSNPLSPGLIFKGWYTDNSLGEEFNFNSFITKDTTLYTRWTDAEPPKISGITNGKIYCKEQTITVTDNNAIKKVTLSGTPVTPDTNGQLLLSPQKGEQTIIATDNFDNTTTVKVTINDGHEGGTATCKANAVCKHCGEQYGEINSNNHAATEVRNAKAPTCTEDGFTGDTYCKDCGTKLQDGQQIAKSGHTDANKDHICDAGTCKATISTCSGGTATCKDKAVCDYCGKPYGEINSSNHAATEVRNAKAATCTEDGFTGDTYCKGCDTKLQDGQQIPAGHTDANKDHICDVETCKATISTCSGGTATCKNRAVCDYCGKPYGEADNSNHNLENIKESAATVTETGNVEYWHCKDCDNNFSDMDGKTQIDLENTVTPKLIPEIIDGKRQSLIAGERCELTFRSNAAYSDFIRVEIDGKTVDEKKYTVKEGSTIVTLKADYVATLSEGEHTLGIVSVGGTAPTTFTVNAKGIGDNSHIILWFAVLFVIVGALAAIVVYVKKRKNFTK